MRNLKLIAGLIAIAASLFGPAGTMAWPGAWIFLILFIGGMATTMGWLKRHDPVLFEQRRRPFRQSGQPEWDRVIGLALVVVWFGFLVLMGLDTRFSGGPKTPLGLMAPGSALIIAGYLLMAASFKANTFAITSVRLQSERSQAVIDTGPYGIVRHPIYSASALLHLGTVLLLGSLWGVFGLALLIFLLGLRAVLEERTLLAGLPSYGDYTMRVRFRLAPGIW
jgi:Putative protein-S-isoprenylcysteine methyltransferase